MQKNHIVIVAAAVFVLGAGYFIYSGRPVVQMERGVGTAGDAYERESDGVADVVESESTEDAMEEVGTAPQGIAVGEPNPSAPAEATPKPSVSEPSADRTYVMADVEAHATAESCWATINGNVYDLTTWIARHPGGPDKIIGLCGKDGTERFTRKHGTFAKAIDMLALLKIGTLVK